MVAHLALAKNVGPPDRQIIKTAFTELRRRTALALAAATVGDARFNSWFCPAGTPGRAAIQNSVVNILTQMNNFLNGNVSYTLFVSKSPTARTAGTTYGYVYADANFTNQIQAGSQLIIYYGTSWNTGLAVGQAATGAAHGRSSPVQVLAHELSHHFGTNGSNIAGGAYANEQYDAAALAIVGTAYASFNADNYGYFIEEM